MIDYRTVEVDVEGGSLHVGVWGNARTAIVCLHGITANHRSFLALAEQLADEFMIIAPDLRGRGGSNRIAGPFGIAAHADDVAKICKAFDLDQVVLVGHSMGAFVSLVTAHRHPTLVKSMLLIDGGIPLNLGPLAELPPEDLVNAIIGPSLQRLKMRFESPQAYLDFWKQHPVLSSSWNPYLEDYILYDLVGEEPELRSSVREDAVITDGSSELQTTDLADALEALEHPVHLLRAERGLIGPDPLYAEDWIAQWRPKLPTLTDEVISGVDHFTIGVSEHGARQVAERVRRMIS